MIDARCDSQVAATSFLIRVTFCQNASYQGEITWLEGKRTQQFRSALELISLIGEAVAERDGPSSDYQLRSWPEKDEISRIKPNVGDLDHHG